MNKQKIFSLIPFLLLTGFLSYCWIIILATDIAANWRQYTGLGLFFLLVFSFFKENKKAIVGIGIYLLLATFDLIAFTPTITTSQLVVAGISTPPVQLLSLGLFVLYVILNMDVLIDMQLDYKEAKAVKRSDKE